MVIAVFGASGKVGRLVVAEALARGYTVRAFIHSKNPLPNDPNLQTVRGDIRNKDAVLRTIHGCDAVICSLGSWGSTPKDVVSAGIRTILPAMEMLGVERIVTLTGTDARDSSDSRNFGRLLSHSFATLVAGKILADGEEHIRLLRKSTRNWTTLRAPVMTNSASIFYKLSLEASKPWHTIPRRAVAKAMVDQIDGPAYENAAPFIHRY